MTAPAEPVADIDLPPIDTCPPCEATNCDKDAEVRAKYFHIDIHPDSCENGRLFLLCTSCLEQSINTHQKMLDRVANLGGIAACGRCQERFTCVHDLIRSVVPL